MNTCGNQPNKQQFQGSPPMPKAAKNAKKKKLNFHFLGDIGSH